MVILARHAFGYWVPVECVERTGIEDVRPEHGEVFKLIAEAVLMDGSLRLRVGPQKLAPSDPMAHVNDENNAVLIEGDFAGSLTFIGRQVRINLVNPEPSRASSSVAEHYVPGPVFGVPVVAAELFLHLPIAEARWSTARLGSSPNGALRNGQQKDI